MKHFLLLYNIDKGHLINDPVEFDDAKKATAAYEQAEEHHLLDEHMQIVLVASDSLDTVKATHGNFFEKTDFDQIFRSILEPAKP